MRSLFLFALMGSLCLTTVATGCSDETAQQVAATGTVRLSLVGTSSTGVTYRLRNAAFQIIGTVSARLSTETEPDAVALIKDLPAGDYSAALATGWYLEKQTNAGAFERVKAALVSQNPVAFGIVAQDTTTLLFRFRVGEDVLEFGEGRVEIGIEVEDGGGGAGGGGTGGTAGEGGNAPGLVFHCTFDSEAAITTPALGRGGVMTGGTFIAGKNGNAFTSSASDEVKFPASVIPPTRGAIEFWAKLIGYDAEEVIPWGQAPYFVLGPSLGFNGNTGDGDGYAGGGLIGGYGARTATGCYWNSVTYGSILGDTTAWHHYALAWDEAGVPGTSSHIQLFLDGNRIGSTTICGGNADAASFPQISGQFAVLNNQRVTPGKSAAIDDLLIYNYAKTDFTDSL